MSKISKDEIQKQIHLILKDADLNVLSAKKVRLELEKILGCELLNRKKEIDSIVMDFINSQEKEDDDDDDDDDDDEESSEEEKDESQSRKRTSKSNNKQSSLAKKQKETSDGEDSDFKPILDPAIKNKRGGRNRRSGDSVKPKPAPRKKAAGSGKPRGTGFTRSVALSPQLAALMGADSLPRHEVVKKMWSIIKEKNLYCPKNKQFAICDDALYKVMGVKRFRTFGMLKYLKTHFVD